jgi:pimeloyl-ACP methyl ester carboxylesterase
MRTENKTNIIILHGWGSNPSRWSKFIKLLQQKNKQLKIFCPQLPGFGASKLNKPWNLDDYVSWLENFCKKHCLKKVVLIGHSFGGRIAIKYSVKHAKRVQKMVLINSAGIRTTNMFKKKIFYILAKLGKNIFQLPGLEKLYSTARKILYKLAREKDYFKADSVMQKTMKKIINVDLKNSASLIKCPTLLIWGKDDKITPLKIGEILQDKIEKSRLVIFQHAGHGLPVKNPERIINTVWKYIKK